MPGFDRTGPMGEGSRTGRGLGRCGNGNAKETQRPAMGRGSWTNQENDTAVGSGAGRGGRRGRGGAGRRGRI